MLYAGCRSRNGRREGATLAARFLCMPAQGQPGRGEQEGERQGGEPQYLAGQYRRSGVMGKGVRHLACRAGAALGGRGSALRGRARCGGGRDFWEESRCVPGADECGAVTFRSWMGPSRAAGGWSGSRRSADGAGQALPDLGRTRTQVACRLQAVLRPGFPASLGRSPRAAAGGQGAARQAGARLWRLAAVLAVLTCGLLASAAAVPPAFATMLPDEGPPVVGVPATATAQQPDKPGSPARASPCSEVCSGGGYASGNSTTRPPAYSLPMILPGAGAPGPCSEVCSGGGYGSVGPSSRTPGESSAHDTATIPPAGGRVTDSAGFHWGRCRNRGRRDARHDRARTRRGAHLDPPG